MELPVAQNKSSTSNVRIKLNEKLWYGAGDFGCNLIYANIAAFLTFFYTDIVGMSGAVIGSIIFISRIFDGVSDILMGTLVDKTEHKLGKTRPWILLSAVPLGVGLMFLFTAPNFGETGNIIYLFLMYNLVTTIFYTMYAVPHNTLVAIMTQDQYERSTLNISRMVMGTLGALFVNVTAIKLVSRLGGGTSGWKNGNIVYGILAIIIIILSGLFTKERVKPRQKKREKHSLKERFIFLVKNKYWDMTLVLGIVVYGIMALSAANVYYVTYILKDSSLMGSLMIYYFASSILGMLIMSPVVMKIGKRNTVFIGFLIYIIGTAVILTNTEKAVFVFAGTFIKGIGLAPLVGSLPSFIADTIEYGEWKTGIRAEGLVYSSSSFGQKFGNGVATAIFGWLLSLSGYIGGAVNQTDAAITTITSLFTYVPVTLYGIAVIVLLFYKLDKEYAGILEDLSKN
ncbi:MAG: sugar (Glycoside-Pentoside-Hexuronide) transporter [Sedimentibacter sp.]|jgi:GPH family glycoside/pentoside/hexuronide:cation symporter|nr:sugar (Glycoside-Pentoside-Hexuronide) transporter [Sedimentibacter sp.]